MTSYTLVKRDKEEIPLSFRLMDMMTPMSQNVFLLWI